MRVDKGEAADCIAAHRIGDRARGRFRRRQSQFDYLIDRRVANAYWLVAALVSRNKGQFVG